MDTIETKTEVFSSFIRQMLNEKKRSEYESKLKNDFGVMKSSVSTPPKKRKHRKLFIISGIAAALCVLFYCTNSLGVLNKPDNFVSNFITNDYFIHPGNEKGRSQSDTELRSLAIIAYRDRDFMNSAAFFDTIESKTSDDQFFAGLSHLYKGDYTQSIQSFTVLRSDTSVFREEINWYLSIAYLSNNEIDQALAVLSQIQEDQWNFHHAQELIKEYSE